MDQHQRQSVNELVNRESMALRSFWRSHLMVSIDCAMQLRAPVRDLVIGNNTAQSLNDDQ
ncbi:hypothetical protein COLO4_36293 [Corchorus olitorius]|uniref:Uncharacterized protein n=1 Tax=Corchorus olitorius TaxID=93759 RepID=A0A1R3GA58_9ROSI|nr:hypothetical protein COLO4_36293 [Corchorus olitorius]